MLVNCFLKFDFFVSTFVVMLLFSFSRWFCIVYISAWLTGNSHHLWSILMMMMINEHFNVNYFHMKMFIGKIFHRFSIFYPRNASLSDDFGLADRSIQLEDNQCHHWRWRWISMSSWTSSKSASHSCLITAHSNR